MATTGVDVRGGDASAARRAPTRGGLKRGDEAPFRGDERPRTAAKPDGLAAFMPAAPGFGDAQPWYGRGEAPAPELPLPREKVPRSTLTLQTAVGGGLPFKNRSSSCSFGHRTPLSDHRVPVGPGPLNYKIPEQITRYGWSNTPSFSMGRRTEPQPAIDPTVPGPGEYSPETKKLVRGPAFSLLGRRRLPNSSVSLPAPNQYSLPPCIGVSVPHKPNSGAVRFNGRPKEDTRNYYKSPGPAQYALPPVSAYMTQAPRASIAGKKKLPLANESAFTPAPSAYSVERASSAVRHRTPRFSFGVRHADTAHTMKGPEDE